MGCGLRSPHPCSPLLPGSRDPLLPCSPSAREAGPSEFILGASPSRGTRDIGSFSAELRRGASTPGDPVLSSVGGGGPLMGVSWDPEPPEMSPGPRQNQAAQERPRVWLQMGDPGRDGRRCGLSTAPGTGRPARPQERRGQTDGPPREAPQAGPGGAERGRRWKWGHRGGRVPRRTPSRCVPAPRRTALPRALPDHASGALAGLFPSAEAPGPVGARRRRVGRGRGRC